MKILFVMDTLGSGGRERQLVELLKGLDRRKDVEYCLFLLSENIHYDDGKTLKGQVRTFKRRPGFDRRVAPELYALCRKFKPDIIHCWDVMPSFYALPVSKLLRILSVSSIRNAPKKIPLFSTWWVRTKITYPLFDYIIANSHAGVRSYNLPPKKASCIHNGFDFGRLTNLREEKTVRDEFGIRSEKVVGMVARFQPSKDHETFLRSAIKVCSHRKDVTFLAIGDGRNWELCKALVKPEFSEHVRFLGKQKNVESIVNIFDVGVLATYEEGISNAIMEYMALAKPVVATDGGGTSELVVDNVTGFLVPTSNSDVMSSKIDFLLDHPDKAREMGKAGRKRLEADFNIEKMSDAYVQAYRGFLLRHHS